MRIVSYGPAGAEQPGVIAPNGRIVSMLPVFARAGIQVHEVNDLLALWPAVQPYVEAALDDADDAPMLGEVRLGAPVPRPGKVVGVGLNYPRHAGDLHSGEPIIFLKPPTCVCGPNDPLISPPETHELDYEVELGVVIGRAGRRVTRENALAHVAGYLVANDVTAHDIAVAGIDHNSLLPQITRAKSFPTFCPLGPWLLTADEVPADEPLRLWLSVNGAIRQDAVTSDMLIDVLDLVASLSATMDLLPGDVILTGTPSGCGFQLDPPTYLMPGDRIQAGITGLGDMDQVVRAEVPALSR